MCAGLAQEYRGQSDRVICFNEVTRQTELQFRRPTSNIAPRSIFANCRERPTFGLQNPIPCSRTRSAGRAAAIPAYACLGFPFALVLRLAGAVSADLGKSPITDFSGHIETTGHFLQPAMIATGQIVIRIPLSSTPWNEARWYSLFPSERQAWLRTARRPRWIEVAPAGQTECSQLRRLGMPMCA